MLFVVLSRPQLATIFTQMDIVCTSGKHCFSHSPCCLQYLYLYKCDASNSDMLHFSLPGCLTQGSYYCIILAQTASYAVTTNKCSDINFICLEYAPEGRQNILS